MGETDQAVQEEAAVRHRPRLKRLREALATRDWVAIGIELVVVTLGVLLAFQIEQWGERQKKAKEERQFLERLYRENAETITEMERIVPIHERAVKELGLALRAGNNPAQLAQYARQNNFGCAAAMQPSVGFSDTAFQELVASGRLNILSDHQLRGSLRQLTAAQSAGSAQLAYSRQQVSLILPVLNPYYRLEISADDAKESSCYIDWPRLVGDQQAVNAAARAHRVHQLMLELRSDMLKLNRKVDSELACILRKEKCSR